MLRVLSRRVALWATGHETWTSATLLQCRWRNDVVAPPKPPEHLPAEIFEWDFLINNSETEEEKQEVLRLKGLYHEAELLNKKTFKTTVDWEEFEGRVPEPIIQKYKAIYAEAVKDYEAGKFDLSFDQAVWDQKTGAIMNHVQAIVADAKKRMEHLEIEIQNTEARLTRLETATLEEELAADPELAKKVDDAVSKELGYNP